MNETLEFECLDCGETFLVPESPDIVEVPPQSQKCPHCGSPDTVEFDL